MSESKECENCYGEGFQNDECGHCERDGYVDDPEGGTMTCPYCDGNSAEPCFNEECEEGRIYE